MDMLAALAVFVRVTETGSFSAVAHEREITQSAVSRQVNALERELGVRLFQRTTRHLALTEDGQAVLDHAREVLAAVEATRDAAGLRRASPSGHVRLALPVFAASVVAARVPELLVRHPELELELISGDRDHDMIEERLDLWLRVGESMHASHVTRRLGATTLRVFASPGYVAARGEPERPQDLLAHDCIVQHRYGQDHLWRFTGPEGDTTVAVSGRFSADNSVAVLRAAVAGVGIALLNDALARPDIGAGRLRPLLTDYTPAGQPLTVVYPSRRNLAPRVRVVIDFVIEAVTGRVPSQVLGTEA
jgi:DNA-binding transcriptional LysR family regulator